MLQAILIILASRYATIASPHGDNCRFTDHLRRESTFHERTSHRFNNAKLWTLDKKVVLLVVWYMLRPTSVHCNATFIVDIFHNGILVEMQTTCNCHNGCVDERNKWHQHIVCPYVVYYLRDIKPGRWTIPHVYVHEVGIFNDILCALLGLIATSVGSKRWRREDRHEMSWSICQWKWF